MRRKDNQLPERARRLRELRKMTGKSQGEMAGELGISTPTLSNHENGLHINAEHAHLYAAYFGVAFTEFWTPPQITAVSQ